MGPVEPLDILTKQQALGHHSKEKAGKAMHNLKSG
jgi:hypothetical protein